MKTNGNDKALESYKIFPIIAWITTLGFAFFVYTIAMDLKDTAAQLGAQTDLLQQNARTPAGDIVDFDKKSN
jgi:hypothetical protein